MIPGSGDSLLPPRDTFVDTLNLRSRAIFDPTFSLHNISLFFFFFGFGVGLLEKFVVCKTC